MEPLLLVDEDIDFLRDAVQRYLVVVIKGQQHETPYKNWELLKRLDPEAPEFTDEEWSKMYHPEGQGIGVSSHHSNPCIETPDHSKLTIT